MGKGKGRNVVGRKEMTLKKLILINGTMGMGKSAVCNHLLHLLPDSVFLDGDWCWNMEPFVVNDETKAMVMNNITYILRSYLNCSVYQHVIFCWVMDQQAVMQDILNRLSEQEFQTYRFTLSCTEKALRKRLEKDVELGIRTRDVVERSVQKLPLYRDMDTVKIDVTRISAQHAAQQIASLVEKYPFAHEGGSCGDENGRL